MPNGLTLKNAETVSVSAFFCEGSDTLVIRLVFIRSGHAVLTVNDLDCEGRERLTYLSRLYFNVLHRSAKTDDANLQNSFQATKYQTVKNP